MEIIWIILGFVSSTLLFVYWGGRNAVWGGFTIGLIVGFGFAILSNFDWFSIGKWTVSGTLVGFVAELLGKFADKIRVKK